MLYWREWPAQMWVVGWYRLVYEALLAVYADVQTSPSLACWW